MEAKIRGPEQGLEPIPASKNEILGLISQSPKNHVVGKVKKIKQYLIMMDKAITKLHEINFK